MSVDDYFNEAEKKHRGTVFHLLLVIVLAQFFFWYESRYFHGLYFLIWTAFFALIFFVNGRGRLALLYLKTFALFSANGLLAYFSGLNGFVVNVFLAVFFLVSLLLAARNCLIILSKPPQTRYMPVATILLGNEIKSVFGYVGGIVCLSLPGLLCLNGFLTISQAVRLLALFFCVLGAVQFLTFLIILIFRRGLGDR